MCVSCWKQWVFHDTRCHPEKKEKKHIWSRMNSTVGSCPLRWQKKRKGQSKDLDALQPWPILTSRLRKIPIHWWLLGASAYPTKLHSWKWLSLGSIVKIVNWTKQSQGPAVYWGKGFFAEKRHVIEEKLSHGRLAARGRKTSWQKLVSQYSIIFILWHGTGIVDIRIQWAQVSILLKSIPCLSLESII